MSEKYVISLDKKILEDEYESYVVPLAPYYTSYTRWVEKAEPLIKNAEHVFTKDTMIDYTFRSESDMLLFKLKYC